MLLFMILFRFEGSQTLTEDTEKGEKLFYMIPSADNTDVNVQSQARKDNLDLKELAARDSFDDPTIMSFPNKKYGFSVERRDRDEPPMPFVKEYHLPLIPVEEPLSERVPLVGIYPDPAGNDTGSLQSPAIGEITLLAENISTPDRIVWLENGKEVKSPLNIEDIRKLAAGAIPTARTEIKIEKLKTSPVLFLTGKSGVAALDKTVMEYMRSKLLKVFTGESKASDLPNTISVDWRLILR